MRYVTYRLLLEPDRPYYEINNGPGAHQGFAELPGIKITSDIAELNRERFQLHEFYAEYEESFMQILHGECPDWVFTAIQLRFKKLVFTFQHLDENGEYDGEDFHLDLVDHKGISLRLEVERSDGLPNEKYVIGSTFESDTGIGGPVHYKPSLREHYNGRERTLTIARDDHDKYWLKVHEYF